jgi:hypothetical protein
MTVTVTVMKAMRASKLGALLSATDGQPTNATGGGPMTTTDHAKKEANQ